MESRVALISLVAILILMPSLVFAVPSFTASPPVIDIDAEARDIITREITITNTGGQPLVLYPTVNNISLNEGGTIEEFLPPVESDRTSSLASWIAITRGGITVPKHESRTVPITIHINPNPVDGEYHALIGFGFGRNRDEAERVVKTGRTPGVVVTVRIGGNDNGLLRLTRFIIDRFITSGDNQAAVYTISNPGDEPLSPTGEIIFYNNRGIEVGMLTVNPDHRVIQPGKKEEFTADVPTHGFFGKYKAYLSVEYGPQLATVQDTVYFYVFPLRSILIVLSSVGVLVVLAAILIHRRYLDGDSIDDSEPILVQVRNSHSDPMEHDIDLKRK